MAVDTRASSDGVRTVNPCSLTCRAVIAMVMGPHLQFRAAGSANQPGLWSMR